MTIPDELIKKIVANLVSCDSHYLFVITTDGITIAEDIIRKTIDEFEKKKE